MASNSTMHNSKRKRRKAKSFSFLVIGIAIILLLTSIFALLSFVSVIHQQEDADVGVVSHPGRPFWEMHGPDMGQWKNRQAIRDPDRLNVDPTSTRSQIQKERSNTKNHAMMKDAAHDEALIDMRELTYKLAFDNPDGGVWKQGWDVEIVPKDHVEIFVVPHSHCDPGWIKTFDQYFRQQTSGILDTVISSLAEDSRRTFIWAEISYFSWWWEDRADEKTRNVVRKLLDDGQLEFVTGGWVQPDEANSNFYAMKLQLQEGHDWIKSNLGEQYLPKSAWSIDPFGYSPTAAYLWKSYNMTSMLIQRVHYAVKKELAKRRHLEFYWRQTWDANLTDSAMPETHHPHKHDMFAHVMPFFSYDVPHTCGPDPSVCCQFDFARMRGVAGYTCPWHIPPQPITDHNVRNKANMLLNQYLQKGSLYRSKAVLAPLGDDFRWQTSKEATAQFTNYQKIFDYINSNVDGVTIKFGTLTEYFTRAKETFEGPVPVLKGSFFTYADVNEDYWSGYYTSRVFDKALDRQLERTISAAETLGGDAVSLQLPRRALSLFQHHDGVTGTAKNHVVEDYARRMHEAIHDVHRWMTSNVEDLKGLYPCWVAPAPRDLMENLCKGEVVAYNPLNQNQLCGSQSIAGRSFARVQLPCDGPPKQDRSSSFKFDPATGLMIEPIQEQWKYWKVSKGGAYLFFPDRLEDYDIAGHQVNIENGGFNVSTPHWKRTIYDRTDSVKAEFGNSAIVLDFVFETELKDSNNEWFARFSSDISSEGYFHTDLNGFNFDTHRFRSDLPIQSQVFPMPTLASVEDENARLTIISEHSQGTASLKDGSIDIWLDRRLSQDDNRGLGQGVTDNRRTRTTLRIVLERSGFRPRPAEFEVTPLVRRMWDQIQHPLEFFGKYGDAAAAAQAIESQKAVPDKRSMEASRERRAQDRDALRKKLLNAASKESIERQLIVTTQTKESLYVPIVFMVFKRLDYLKTAIDSVRKSDFPKDRVPLIVSVDGHVADVLEYLDTLKEKFPTLIKLVHPFACYDHPDSFPGDDPKLNENYKGDTYGNPRTARVTCCKHHFTWLLSTVFSLDALRGADSFLFMEEDYVVAKNFYSAIANGFNAIEELNSSEIMGLSLDTSHGGLRGLPKAKTDSMEHSWQINSFVSGPMTMDRNSFSKLQQNAKDYCQYDEYNWDWSFVHLQSKRLLPFVVLEPFSSVLAQHFGVEGGMHGHERQASQKADLTTITLPTFAGTHIRGSVGHAHPRGAKPNGGWGHPEDQKHCLKLLDAKP